jgi:hypothetical protein
MTGFYNVGLGFATALSVSNVITDVLRKKALQPNDLYSISFLLRSVSTLCFAAALGLEVIRHDVPLLHSNGPLLESQARTGQQRLNLSSTCCWIQRW